VLDNFLFFGRTGHLDGGSRRASSSIQGPSSPKQVMFQGFGETASGPKLRRSRTGLRISKLAQQSGSSQFTLLNFCRIDTICSLIVLEPWVLPNGRFLQCGAASCGDLSSGRDAST